MSYCRWSSDNWKCDLYCYADVSGGYTTHVAGRRRIGLDSLPPDPLLFINQVTSEEWVKLHDEHTRALAALPWKNIELPHAGETFSDETLADFKARILYLREIGYHVPDYVIEAIDEEIAEETADAN